MQKLFILIMLCSVFELSFAQNNFILKSETDKTSCFNYSVVDSNEQKVQLPKHIAESLKCPSSIGLKGNYLTYVDGVTVKLYNLKTKQDYSLFSLYEDIDGFSSPAWSEDGKGILFVIVNQEMKHNYKSMCRIMYIKLKDTGEMNSKRKFDRTVNFACGSICNSQPETDFRFNKKGNIEYRMHVMLSEDENVWKEIAL